MRLLFITVLIIGLATVVTAQTAALKNYYNQENKVGFKYPGSWVTGKNKWDVKTERAWIDSEEPGFTILMDLSNPDLQIRSYVNQAEVSLSVATIDEGTCKAMKIENLNPDNPVTATRKVGTRTFYLVSSSDGAAGSVGSTDFYRTFHDGKCYELAFMKFGPNTPKRPDANEKRLDQQFNAILRSLYFGK